MDRVNVEKRLAETERHVARGEENLATQRAIVAKLERSGHNLHDARQLLAQLEDSQAMHVAHRDRLLEELRPSNRPAPPLRPRR